MSKWNVGDKVRFNWYSDLISGVVLQIKERRLRKPKYQVAYGVGDFGYKVRDSIRWVDENDIFPHDIALITGRHNPQSKGETKHG